MTPHTRCVLVSALLCAVLQVCGKALEADEEEQEQQKQHFTGQTEAGRTPIQGPPGQQPHETQEQGGAGAESKAAELSGGEKISERREGGQQPQQGQQPTQKQRRYLIHEFPGRSSNTHSQLGRPDCDNSSTQAHSAPLSACLLSIVGRVERTIRLPADAQEVCHTSTAHTGQWSLTHQLSASGPPTQHPSAACLLV